MRGAIFTIAPGDLARWANPHVYLCAGYRRGRVMAHGRRARAPREPYDRGVGVAAKFEIGTRDTRSNTRE